MPAGLVEAESCSGEAAADEAGLVLDFLRAVPGDLEQVCVAGEGEAGGRAALEDGPDAFHRLRPGAQDGS